MSSTNLFTLARAAPEAAILDEIDLLELLPEPEQTPAKPMQAVALAS